MMRPVAVLGVGYVAEQEEPLKLDLGLLERTLRRGLSDTTRLFMHSAQLALREAAVAPEQVHVIFASAFGEIATAEALLREAYDADGSSPARFRNSVHNTATGLFSISTKNYLPATAIAAGWDTVGMALCEASAELESGAERVLLVFAEERVPLPLSDDHQHRALSAAFVLARPSVTAARGYFANLRRSSVASSAADRAHPLAPALALALAIEAQRACTIEVGELSLSLDVLLDVPEEAS